ncbi:FAD-dependent oxidoreductase [Bacillus thuringiensis serovar muju]|nr:MULTISPECIES: FAD-dependent oxidoreductase [Bacillus cereus group]MBH0345850.1 FAD-dependent oxidoreductase [Bacillus thuringiensis]OTY04792.1 FAD-dependent oxidoreductase [Bacillus thuringiensis serovar muju]
MDLQTGKLYWNTTFSNTPSYPRLEEDIKCDVLIIGAGSSGAQSAYYLSESDLKIVVVDKRKVGHGSNLTNTALIQYLGDKMFFELVNTFGEEYAVKHMKLCEQAINDIEYADQHLPYSSDFKRRDSLYYASYEEDIKKLEKELYYLHKHDFKATWLSEEQIGQRYPFKKRAAIYTYNDGEINPYKFTHSLLKQASNKGVHIYEDTEIVGKKLAEECAIFYTKGGNSITANKVIVAAGYEGLEFKKEKNATMISSYAIVTNPVEDLSSWYKRTLIWETARPYIYMRTTADNRIIIGGLDEDTNIAQERDSKLIHKKEKLVNEFNKLFPNITVEPEFYLSAFYGGTHDGLPIIGMYEEFPNCHFIYAYGDNGLVYSMTLSKIVRDVIISGSSPDLNLYLQTRPKLNE